MIILDFLFYYLTYWFEKNKDKLRWSTPLERSAYAVGLISMVWIMCVEEILTYTQIFVYHLSMIIYHYCPTKIGLKNAITLYGKKLQVKNSLFQNWE